jgi:hypothetical protein
MLKKSNEDRPKIERRCNHNEVKDLVKVGDLATLHGWSDCSPFDVVKVSPNGKKITLRLRGHKMVEEGVCHPGGFAAHWSKMPKFETFSDPDGRCVEASLRKNGKWKKVGWPMKSPGAEVTIGQAVYYYDYNF